MSCKLFDLCIGDSQFKAMILLPVLHLTGSQLISINDNAKKFIFQAVNRTNFRYVDKYVFINFCLDQLSKISVDKQIDSTALEHFNFTFNNISFSRIELLE